MPVEVSDTAITYQPSEDYQEIVGQYPKRLSFYMTVIILFIIGLLLFLGFFVEYRDVVSAKLTVVPEKSPKPITSKSNSRLIKLFVKEGDTVKAGATLAYMESIGDPTEVLSLSQDLARVRRWVSSDQWDSIEYFHETRYQRLGELQMAYQTFAQLLIESRAFLEKGIYSKLRMLMLQSIEGNADLRLRYEEQLKIHEEDYKLALLEYNVKEKLYEDRVVPMLEVKQERSRLINKQLPIENDKTAIINNEVALTSKKQDLVNLQQQAHERKMAFIQGLSTLTNEVDKWKNSFIVQAPIDGKVTFSNFVKENQVVEIGQELCYVLPPSNSYYGEMLLQQDNLGKVDTGQTVMIRLRSHQYQEFGMLVGSISSISEMPGKDGTYPAIVKMDSSLVTNYGFRLTIHNESLADAEVVTKSTKLIGRFIQAIFRIRDRPKLMPAFAKEEQKSKRQ